MGKAPTTESPDELKSEVETLLAQLDRRAVESEIKRRAALAALDRLAEILDKERSAIYEQWSDDDAKKRSSLLERIKRWNQGVDGGESVALTGIKRTGDQLEARGRSSGKLRASWSDSGNGFTVKFDAQEGQFDTDGPCEIKIVGQLEWDEFIDFVNHVDRAIHAK